ncbi:MAG: DoxX family protein [Crocinitomicaceae bacterium]|nr:DoxX family protein [Crocinitomicaceae bacterium]
MKAARITHWIFTGLLSALLLMSASMYVFNHDEVSLQVAALGFPVWIIYPLAVMKVLGVLMILTKFKTWLTEWAYAGMVFNMLLAFGAHMAAGDGEQFGAVIAFVLVIGSFATWKSGWKAS